MHAEKYRVVTESAIPGPWQNIVTPYLVDIMDAADYPSVLTVILCKCVQSGGSEAAHNFIGYSVDRKPGPVMYVYPTKDAGKKQLKKRILTMFKASPHLRRYLTGVVNDETNMEIKLKHMTISIAWAHSATSLASDPCAMWCLMRQTSILQQLQNQNLIPSALVKREPQHSGAGERPKYGSFQPPTTVNGPISVAMRDEAQVVFDYYVKCPECGGFQKMIFKRVKWTGGGDADPGKGGG